MIEAVTLGNAPPGVVDRPAEFTQPDLLDWLRSGRLALINEAREPVEAEQWPDLPAHVRARALSEFHRVVRGNAKAAVIFLRS